MSDETAMRNPMQHLGDQSNRELLASWTDPSWVSPWKAQSPPDRLAAIAAELAAMADGYWADGDAIRARLREMAAELGALASRLDPHGGEP